MKQESGIFFTEDFNDFGTFLSNAKRWNLDFRKLDKGSFWGRLSMLDIGTVQIVRSQISGVIDQVGKIQPGYRTFIIPAGKQLKACWKDTIVGSNNFIVFPRHGHFEAVSYGHFDVFAISIQDEHLNEIALQCNAKRLNERLALEGCVYKMNKDEIEVGQKILHGLFNLLENNAETINSSEFAFKLKYEIPYHIVNFLNKTTLEPIIPLQRKREKALKRSVNYILENIKRNITIGELTKVSKASERTLEYAFMERYGIPPKTYISYSKLNKIKDVLCNPENKELVSTIAKQFGFKHMGQFSADYKKLLGELPRSTRLSSK